jgi:hypothetical protein
VARDRPGRGPPNTLFLITEAPMRFPTRLIMLPLIIGVPGRVTLDAQARLSQAPARAPADTITPAVRWNRLVPMFVDEAAASRRAARVAAAGDAAALRRIAQTPPPFLFRIYTLMSVAQYGAVNSARDNRGVSTEAAVASASAAMLTELFKDSTVSASIARELAHDLDQTRIRPASAAQAIAGKNLGEDVARRVLAWAPNASMFAPWSGTVPKGPGMWYSAPGMPPIGINLATSRAWMLDSASQFRPGPPLAFGSAAYQSALEEVRRIARQRTPEQTAIAQKWDAGDPWGAWNATASNAIQHHHLSGADAARVLAVMNVAASDAIIACFEAKYHYWSIRPSQADTTIALADSVGLPNFPSYPSGHACSAGAFDASLGHFFPQDRAEFTRIAEEQAMSRLYGGIHYRFDNDGGLALGRVVARNDVEQEKRGKLNAWRSAVVARKP